MNLKDILIYEDADIMAINKPAGLMVHGDGRSKDDTLADVILKDHPELKTIGEPMEIDGDVIYRPGIVHRLDRDTSGVLLIAKSQEAFLHLKAQFQSHEVKKHYRAFAFGAFSQARGAITNHIGRSQVDIRKRAAGVHARGERREALTNFAVKHSAKVADDEEGKEYTVSYVDIYPKTGRTHQIRVHMQFIQHPLIGDDLYAPYVPKLLGFARQALHAYEITFTDMKGKEKTIEAPLPEDFKKAEKQLGLV